MLRSGDKGEIFIISGGGDLQFAAETLQGLEKILAGETIGIADFTSLEESAGIDSIKKLIAFGIIEKL